MTFRLVAGPFQFNGFGDGGATLTVPPGSINVWNFEQDDGLFHVLASNGSSRATKRSTCSPTRMTSSR